MKDTDRDEAWLLKEKYHGEQTPEFHTDCLRLNAGEPLAYVIGFVPFLNCTIWLDSKPLIPRVETEFWTVFCLRTSATARMLKPKILDLCAGSGCIGVALAKELPTALVTFLDIETAHAETITKNCQGNGIAAERFAISVGNLFAPLKEDAKFNLIVANPPYIDKNLHRTETSVTTYEPHAALFSAESGFSHLRTIILGAAAHLEPRGELWLEHEPEHVALIQEAASTHFQVNTQPDQFGRLRFTQLVLQ